jgi:hypothetical protein
MMRMSKACALSQIILLDQMMSVWPLVANPKSIYSDSVMPRISRKVIFYRDSRTVSSWILRPVASAPDLIKIRQSLTAELNALDEAIRQAVWLWNFLAELTYPQSKPTVIYVNSKSSIAISESLKTGSNVGHTMRINYIYQEVLAKTVEVKYINTHN